MDPLASRRSFLQQLGLGTLATMAAGGVSHGVAAQAPDAKILGASGVKTAERPKKVWQPVSDRKIRVGIVGFGVCQFGAAFGFGLHHDQGAPNLISGPLWIDRVAYQLAELRNQIGLQGGLALLDF